MATIESFHLLIQTLFCWVRVVVQNLFIVTVSRAVELVLKIGHLLSKVTGYAEWITVLKECSVDAKSQRYQLL